MGSAQAKIELGLIPLPEEEHKTDSAGNRRRHGNEQAAYFI
jgi:hypothetical protein